MRQTRRHINPNGYALVINIIFKKSIALKNQPYYNQIITCPVLTRVNKKQLLFY